MIGAITGDIAGSRFEWHNNKSKDFKLFTRQCSFTDDSVMTLAVCDALMNAKEDLSNLSEQAVRSMQSIGRNYPYCGYGGRFIHWIFADDPEPYNSFGNGSAMRVSGCAYAGRTIEEVIQMADAVTVVTHDHPEGVKGAEAIAVAAFLARTGSSKEEIRKYVEDNFYHIDFTLDEIRDCYEFDVTCQGSVPQALEAFYESTDFEDAIRNAISIGGDSDTIAAMTGAVAEAFYGVPDETAKTAYGYLDERLQDIYDRFRERYVEPTENGYEDAIVKLRLMLEYKTYCIWLYNEDDEIVDNDNPPEWEDDKELTDAWMAVSALYDTFFIDNEKEFAFIGCPDEETKQRLKDLVKKAEDILYERNNGKYIIQDDMDIDYLLSDDDE